MTAFAAAAFDPTLDLKLERVIHVTPEQVWEAWTDPLHVVHWFTPAPWTTTDCEIDLRPGGIFRTVMQSPEGEEHDSTGCFLAIEPGRMLVFTDTLLPGYRPNETPLMTAIVLIEPHAEGAKYTAMALHKSEADRRAHEEMGFHDGWGKALDQLVAYAQAL